MKKLIAFILASALVMSLVACGSAATVEAAEENEATVRFQVVEEKVSGLELGTEIVVDTYTGVMYLYNECGRGMFGICPLLNTDGTPMIWEGYNK